MDHVFVNTPHIVSFSICYSFKSELYCISIYLAWGHLRFLMNEWNYFLFNYNPNKSKQGICRYFGNE